MRKADNLPPSCAVVTKSGNLNFLELSGPVQACNGIALPFYPLVPRSRMNGTVPPFRLYALMAWIATTVTLSLSATIWCLEGMRK